MKLLAALISCSIACITFAAEALDPISVGIAMEAGSYVIGEKIPVQVLIRNNTPNEIVLGAQQKPVAIFTVTKTKDVTKVPLMTDPHGAIPGPQKFAPNEQRVFNANLAENVDLREAGSYFISFGAIYKDICYNTQVKSIDIVPGYLVAKGTQLFVSDQQLQRHFILVRWTRNHIDRLFLRIEDTPAGTIHSTELLGAYLPLVKPRLNIASNGEITILHRATPEYYVRNVFWSLPDDIVHRSRVNLLDPGTADTNRLNGMRNDLDEIIQKNEKLKEAIRLR